MFFRFFKTAILAIGILSTAIAQDGSQDLAFNPGSGFTDGEVRSIGILSTGEVIAVGAFIVWDGNSVNRIVKLRTDGTIDFGFLGNMGPGIDNNVNDVAILSDDRIVIGGTFQNVSGNPRDRIAIINPDGSLDGNFDPLGGFNGEVFSVAIEADEQILVGGAFTQFNASDVGGLARLEQNGNLDATFGSVGAGIAGSTAIVRDIEVQSDDAIIIAGEFNSYNSNSSRNLTRLDQNGVFDPTFVVGTGVTGGAVPSVYDVAFTDVEDLLIVGEFTQYDGNVAPNIAKVDRNGNFIPTFSVGSGTDAGIRSVDIAADGYIIIGGTFGDFNGTASEFLVKLDPNGTIDPTFNTSSAADGFVESVVINDNTSLYIGGTFQNYQGSSANRIAKINNSVVCSDLVVTSTLDDGSCGTLRYAINYANSNGGPDTIRFNFVSAPQTINLGSRLPDINDDGTVIIGDFDGICGPDIVIDGGGMNGYGLRINFADDVVISGLVVGGWTGPTLFRGYGIILNNCSRAWVYNCYVGVQADGLTPNGNQNSNIIFGDAANCTIGDTSVCGRNVIGASANEAGITISNVATTNNTIHNNYIGIGVDGVTDIGNSTNGIILVGGTSFNQIGGTCALCKNIISHNGAAGIGLNDGNNNTVLGNYVGINDNGNPAGNDNSGIYINSTNHHIESNVISGNANSGISIGNGGSGTTIVSNLIGTDPTGTIPRPNATQGVRLNTASNNTIGLLGQENTIAYNSTPVGFVLPVSDNTFQYNTFHSNSSTITGSNVSAPVILDFGSSYQLSGTAGYDSNQDSVFFYADSSDQGQYYLGSAPVSPAGTWTFQISPADSIFMVNNGLYNINALLDSAGNTSDFSVYTRPFITTWQTDNIGVSANNQITIPTAISSTYNYNIYWEEVGNITNNGSASNLTTDHTITFPSPGTYRVYIDGLYPHFFYVGSVDQQKLLTIEQWGDISWTSMQQAFFNATNLQVTAIDAPDLSGVTSMNSMFRNASAMNQSIDHWDVSTINDMERMFEGATAFNQNLNSWVVTNTVNMSRMFMNATAFDGNISSWTVSNVQNMNRMFQGATSFTQDISAWNVSSVQSMDYMFWDADNFNHDLPLWDVGNVLTMQFMFGNNGGFNGNITTWNTERVKNMRSMFSGATNFNQNLSNWSVDSVTDFSYMFSNTLNFNADLSSWDVRMGINMEHMFQNASSFNSNISGWDVGNVTNMNSMFQNTPLFDQNLGNWNVSNVTDFDFMFQLSSLSVDNYDSTLIGWEAQPLNSGMTLGAAGLNYCNAATEHANLISTHLWTINDAGPLCPCDPLVVTNTSDAGCGSLREAIITANASSGDTITFNILGGGPHVISPSTPLPDITSSVIIDGYSQPGTSSNTLTIGNNANIQIELDGIAVNDQGLDIVNTSNCTIQGLSIYNFNNYGIRITGTTSSNNYILGNFVGIRSDGATATSTTRQQGIQINGGQRNYIGDGTAAGRNVASGNGNSSPGGGIDINGSSADSNFVFGNYCGTDANGLVAIPNQAIGIELRNGASANTIGGINALERNIISGNNIGINFNSSPNNNIIIGNYIGVGADSLTAIPNISGINFDGSSSNNRIGGTNLGDGNLIAFHSAYGIRVSSSSFQNTFRRNSIYLNTNGITLNAGANADIPPPIIANVTVSDVSGYGVSGNTIDLYQDDQGSVTPQGNIYLGTSTVVNGSWTVGSLSLSGGEILRAIATDPIGNSSEFGVFQDGPEIEVYNGNNTASPLMTSGVSSIDFGTLTTGDDSTRTFTIENIGTDLDLIIDSIRVSGTAFQINNSITTISNGSNASFTVSLNGLTAGTFSETVTIFNNEFDEGNYIFTVTGNLIACDSLIVTSMLDDGSCGTLRGALNFSNSNPGKDTIVFSIPSASPWNITISSNLPTITEEVVIDGSTQPGWAQNNLPTVRDAGSATRCFNINTDSVEIYGMRITGFNTSSDYPIFSTAGNSGMVIGAPFKGNVINGNYHGMWLRGPGNIIQGNKIGTDSSGTIAIPNDYGLRLDNCNYCIIGGSGAGESNLISGNLITGLRILDGNYSIVQGNLIGTDVTGSYAIPNGSTGITLGFTGLASDSNLIGGTNPGELNIVSGNGSMGIRILAGQGNEVYGNYVGTDITGMNAIPNSTNGISLGFVSGYEADYNKVGGQLNGQGNLIIGGGSAGIHLGHGTGNTIFGNTIGLDIVGDTIFSNTNSGIYINSSDGINQNIIGGFGSGQSNIIVGNTQYGVRIAGDAVDPANENKVQGNIYYFNDDGAIQLIDDANNNVLPPVINNYTTGFGSTVSGTCSSCAVGDSIDVYRDSTNSVNTQANEYLGSVVFSSDPWSLGGLSLNPGDRITAQMTDAIGNSSAFFDPEPEIEVFFGSDTSGVNILDGQPGIVDLGKIHIGDSIDATFTIFNNGLELLIIDTIQFSSGPPEFYIVDFGSDTLLPFEIDTFVLRFYSPSLGIETGVLRINNNDIDESVFSFSFTAETIEPEIDVYFGSNTSGFLMADGISTANFGSDIQGNDITRTFTIQNTGTEDLYITSIVVTGTDYSINSSIDTITIGATDTFTVTLSGLAVGSFTETLTIHSNDPDEDSFDIIVDGTITPGPEPEIDIYLGLNNSGTAILNNQLGQIDFGSTVEGNDSTLIFAIENTGTADLTISGISVGGTDFIVLNTITTISVGAIDTFSVTLTGATIGSFNDTISILNDDSDENPYEFPITGTITPCNYLVVTGVLDDGSCGSLRGAITTANATGGIDTITFTAGASSGSIDLLSDLPTITDEVIIDGSSSPLWSGKPVIDIISTVATTGLDIQANGTKVNGIAFSNLNGVNNIIQISADSAVIDNVYFSVDTTGLVSGSPSVNAIRITNSTGHSITNNLFARSSNLSIDISATTNSIIDNNIFGTSIAYDQIGGNWEPRVAFALNSNCDSITISNNLIATTFAEAIAHYDSKHTVITGNHFGADTSGVLGASWGTTSSWLPMFNSDSCLIENNIFLNAGMNDIYLANSNYNMVFGNHFGVEIDGTTTSSSHLSNNAIWISNSHSNQIGGFNSIEGNIITANTDAIRIESDSLNTIWGNSIYNAGGLGINIFSGQQENIVPPIINLSADTVFSGTSSPNALIQLFADARSQGQIFIDTVRADALGIWRDTLSVTQISNFIGMGLDSLTAVQDSNGNSSMFSNPIAFYLKTPISWSDSSFTILNGNVIDINIINSLIDPDGILDTSNLSILTGLVGNSPSSIDTTNGILTIDLTTNQTLLIDSLEIEVCDIYGDCSARYITFNIINQSFGTPIVHNAISIKDQDGKNDFLTIENIEHYPNSRIRIYNKWGTQVGDITNYDNDSNRWSGLFNGQPLPDGTYYYVLWLNSGGKGKPFDTGFIELR